MLWLRNWNQPWATIFASPAEPLSLENPKHWVSGLGDICDQEGLAQSGWQWLTLSQDFSIKLWLVTAHYRKYRVAPAEHHFNISACSSSDSTDGHWWGHCLLPAPLLTQHSLPCSIPPLLCLGVLSPSHLEPKDWNCTMPPAQSEKDICRRGIVGSSAPAAPSPHPSSILSLDLEGLWVGDWVLLSGLGEIRSCLLILSHSHRNVTLELISSWLPSPHHTKNNAQMYHF